MKLVADLPLVAHRARVEPPLPVYTPGVENAPGVPFVVVPDPLIAGWGRWATFTCLIQVDHVDLGRRSLIRWTEGRWFFELRAGERQKLGKGVGQHVTVVLEPADERLPEVLLRALEAPAVLAVWQGWSPARQRALREELLARKSDTGRQTHIARAFAACPPRPARMQSTLATPLTLVVRAFDFPGRTCGDYSAIRVGLAPCRGKHPSETAVPADLASFTWTCAVGVIVGVIAGDLVRYTGPAVQGDARQPFVYLTWLGRLRNEPEAMFRRLKLRLDAVPADTLETALALGTLTAALGLRDALNMPRCGSVFPPTVLWSAG